jgi:hypothetical protein
MDHAVAVGAEQPKIPNLRFVTQSQRVYRLDVVAFDKALASVPIPFAEVKLASLANQPPKHDQCASLLAWTRAELRS